MAQLAAATGNSRHHDCAEAAMVFEESLYDEDEGNWLDMRQLGGPKTAAAWCHGAVGIGLAQLDLDPALEKATTKRTLERAVAATLRLGLGWSHCLCHGDLGSWELLDTAFTLGMAPGGVSREEILSGILTSMEDVGLACGLLSDICTPNIFTGQGGIAYQLLRAHPDCTAPSVLTLGGSNF